MNIIILVIIIILIIVCLGFAILAFNDGDSGKGIISVVGMIIGVLSIFLLKDKIPESSPYSTDYNGLSEANSNSTDTENKVIGQSTSNATSDVPALASNEPIKLSSLNYFAIESGWLIVYKDNVRMNVGDYAEDCFMFNMASWNEENFSYILNGAYSKMTGTIFLEYDSIGTYCVGKLNVWGDNKLLYTSPEIKDGFIPKDFEIDISNVNVLKIGYEDIQATGNKRGFLCISNVTLIPAI